MGPLASLMSEASLTSLPSCVLALPACVRARLPKVEPTSKMLRLRREF